MRGRRYSTGVRYPRSKLLYRRDYLRSQVFMAGAYWGGEIGFELC